MIRARHLLLAGLFVLSTTAFVDLHGQSKLIQVGSDRIENEYIVVLNDETLAEDVADIADDLAVGHNALLRETWSHAIKGFFAEMTEEEAEALSLDSRVAYVEENAPWYFSTAITQQTNIHPATCDPIAGTCSTVTDNRLWHLDRTDQNYASPTNSFSYCTEGSNVTVYVVDGGVNKYHNEFGPSGARVKTGYNATGDLMPANDPCMGFAIAPSGDYPNLEAPLDYLERVGSGHGTAVASVLGGKRVGVAKNVDIVPVKVIRCDYYSARYRRSNQAYLQNETMFRTTNGISRGPSYRAQNSGTTASSEPLVWSATPGATTVDGGVTWVTLPSQDTTLATTTQYLINGVNWILANAVSGPKLVTLSTYRRSTVAGVAGSSGTFEAAIRSLLDADITVIASANNQNGNACDTSPSRLSINNPDSGLANDVITAGGSMIINRPWNVDISDVPDEVEADGPKPGGTYGVEPAYSATLPVSDGRWICGAGDSVTCSNATATATATTNPTSYDTYHNYNGGSNAGPCVTLFAPAKNIFVASPSSASGYRDARVRGSLASGTSWSAPIVAGFAARILENHPTYTPAQVRNELLANSVSTLDPDTLNTYDFTTGLQITGTPNKLLRLGDVNITVPPASTPAALSGTTQLSVTAAGTSTVNYQWYEVNSGFDYATYKNGAHSSTLISGETDSTYAAPASTTTKAYWVRAKNSCGSADSDIVAVVPRPAAPTNVVATASFDTVTITWSAASGAEKYQIERQVSGAWTSVAVVNSGTLSYLHAPSTPTGMTIYRVLSAAGVAYLPSNGLSMSVPSNNDIANLDNDTYENLAVSPSYTTFKAQMLIELRQAANSLAVAAGISSMPYSSGDLLLSSLQGQTIQNEYLTDLMTKINSVRTNGLVNIPTATWSNAPDNDEIITRTFVEQLRDALQ